MKRSLAILLAVLLVLCGASAYGAVQLEKPAYAVSLTEKTLYGDVQAARGLHADRLLRLGQHVSFTAATDFTENGAESTCEYRYTSEDLYSSYYWRGSSRIAEIYSDINSYADMVYGDREYLPEGLPFSGLVEELLKEAPAASAYTKMIHPADYSKYYPVMPSLSYDDVNYGGWYFGDMDDGSRDAAVIKSLENFFRIPIPQSDVYEASVEKGAEGEYLGCSIYPAENYENFYFYAEGAFAEDGVYFWFNNRTSEDRPVDTSLIPGGYGIYRLPMGMRTIENRFIRPGNADPTIDIYDFYDEDLCNFYPLQPEQTVLALTASDSGKSLMAVLRKGDGAELKIIDVHTGKDTASLDLGPLGEDYPELVSQKGFCICRVNDRLFLAQEDRTGCLCLAIASEPKGPELSEQYLPFLYFGNVYNRVFSWDGERLAILVSAQDDVDAYYGARDGLCSWYLALYDKDGLQYYGLMECSLDKAQLYARDYRTEYLGPIQIDAFQVRWSGK